MTRIDAPWLREPSLQHLLATLAADGEEARVVGGAVRNALMERAITDIDIATTTLPAETVRRVEAGGFRAVPTGIEHGTVTVVTREGSAFEVTTLREDVETDGRHATVRFGRSWARDAERRDFTINALSCDRVGEVLDLVGGIADIASGTVRFIGDAATRIAEDRLRVLRFFRFFAWYGRGRPDAEGLRASARAKDTLGSLSAERVWTELRKTLAAPDPARALLWMRQSGVLSAVLPESERWGIDAIHPLVETERALGWPADPMRRLQAIVPPDPARLTELARRLKLANADRDRLVRFAQAEEPSEGESEGAFAARLLFGNAQALADRLALRLSGARAKAASDPDAFSSLARIAARLAQAETFDPPPFPVSGNDLAARGVQPGPAMGRTLDRLRRIWAESGFALAREALLERADG